MFGSIAKQMLDESLKLMSNGLYEEGKDLLEKALLNPEGYEYYMRNNLGRIWCHLDNYDKAYEVLSPNLSMINKMNPYFYAQMSLVMFGRGDKNTAYRMFKKGIKQYEKEARYELAPAWRDYAFVLMQTGAVLGAYKEVLNFYKKYAKKWNTPMIHELACRIALNLQRFDQAIIYSEKAQIRSATVLSTMMKEGRLPWFEISVTLKDVFKDKSFDPTNDELLTSNQIIELLYILFADDISETDKAKVVYHLVLRTKEWGTSFANRILEDEYYEKSLKSSVVDALVEKGVVKPGERVKAIYEGKEIELISGFVEIIPDDLISLAFINEATAIRDSGDIHGALMFLQEKTLKDGHSTPNIMLLLSELFQTIGFETESKTFLDMLEQYEKRVD